MKSIQHIFAIVLLLLATPTFSQQQVAEEELQYSMNRVFAPLSISRDQLNNAKTLADLNRVYKPSWVREYLSVEISAINNGKLQKAYGKSHDISKEQMQIMQAVDNGTEIAVKVKYIPENSLKQNDPKETNFSFLVNPEVEANFPGGSEKMEAYMDANVLSKVPQEVFDGRILAAVQFKVTADGEIVDAHIVETCEHSETDKLFLNAINAMPNWTPACYGNGAKTEQEFVLAIGNQQSCMMNLLNIRPRTE